jgi:hypothetical protein
MGMEASLTDLIRRAQNGETGALQSVFEITYEELRRMARHRLQGAERPAVLDTTALVHECYLRFANAKSLSVEDRLHFFRYAGSAMRSVESAAALGVTDRTIRRDWEKARLLLAQALAG